MPPSKASRRKPESTNFAPSSAKADEILGIGVEGPPARTARLRRRRCAPAPSRDPRGRSRSALGVIRIETAAVARDLEEQPRQPAASRRRRATASVRTRPASCRRRGAARRRAGSRCWSSRPGAVATASRARRPRAACCGSHWPLRAAIATTKSPRGVVIRSLRIRPPATSSRSSTSTSWPARRSRRARHVQPLAPHHDDRSHPRHCCSNSKPPDPCSARRRLPPSGDT